MHSHGSHSNKDNARRVRWALIVTGTFMLVEVAGGLLSGSLALLADAGHMLTDTAALGLALFAFRMSDRPADGKRTFGYQRFQTLAAFVNALTLLLVVGWIIYEAIQRLITPNEILADTMLVVAVGGLIVNLFSFWILHSGNQDNLNIRGASLHVLGDLLGSVAAIAAAFIIIITGWVRIDSVLSIFVALLILRSGWALLKSSGHILLEGTPASVSNDELRAKVLEKIDECIDVHHVHIWSLNDENRLLTMHAEIGESANQADVLRRIKALLRSEFGIAHSTIEVDVGECADDDDPHVHAAD